MFGMPPEDDGCRDDPLFPNGSDPVIRYRPDFDVLAAAPTRILIAVGEESGGTVSGRPSVAAAELLGQQANVFSSHHGGFIGGESPSPANPKLRAQPTRRPRR